MIYVLKEGSQHLLTLLSKSFFKVLPNLISPSLHILPVVSIPSLWAPKKPKKTKGSQTKYFVEN